MELRLYGKGGKERTGRISAELCQRIPWAASVRGFREAAEATRAQYVKLANRREVINLILIVLAIFSFLIAVNAVTGVSFDRLRHLLLKR